MMAKILVTRALPEAEETATRLRALGHAPIVAPLRETSSVTSPLPPEPPEFLIATSRNAFVAAGSLPAPWHALSMHCVGPKTAEAARLAGFTEVHAAAGDAAALVETLMQQIRPGARLLYLAGEPRGHELEDKLRAGGHALQTLVCYRMIRVGSLPVVARQVLASRTCDAVLHFSARSASAYFDLARVAGLEAEAAHPLHACLSPAVAQEVWTAAPTAARRDLDLLVAPEPTGESLIGALHARLG